ncbi:MAG: hypothetical protein ABI318_10290 [Chthoniobacteraceae bacterium]
MNQNPKVPLFSTEIGVMVGLAFGMSGQIPTAILAVIAWFILRSIRPATSKEVLFVTAVIVAETPFAIVAIFASYALPVASVEFLGVLAIALLLFFTRAHVWAYVLLAHIGYIVLMRSLDLYHGAFEQRFQRIVIGAVALRLILAWLLISYLRRPASIPIPETPQPPSSEPGNA